MSKLFDRMSDFLARRKGLLPLIGLALVIVNFLLQFVLPPGWLVSTNLLLHMGIIIAILGFMIAWAL